MSYHKNMPDNIYQEAQISIKKTMADDGSTLIEGYIRTKIKIIDLNVKNEYLDWIRVGAVQLSYNVTEDFPINITNDEDINIDKIKKIITIAMNNDINILCFPEFFISYDDKDKICEVINNIKKISNNMIIILGTFYNDSNENICPVIINGSVYCNTTKIIPSRYESMPIGNMNAGDTTYLYKTMYGNFCIFICRDIEVLPRRVLDIIFYENIDIHLILVPEYNPKAVKYQEIASEIVGENECYLILSNRTKKGKDFGKSSILGKIHDDINKSLIKRGYKTSNSPKYVIIEDLEDDVVIWSDICLKYRAPTLGTTYRRPNSIINELGKVKI